MHPLSSKKILKLAFYFLCFCIISRGLFYGISKGFCIQRIQQPISYPFDLSLPPPTAEQLATLQTITNQPFYYLLKGSQAYAFISKDGAYILKLFKLHHMHSIRWLQSLPCPSWCFAYRDALVQRRQFRIDLTLHSYQLAAKYLSKECALLYTQILPSTAFSLPVTIIDAAHRHYTIDLATVGFVIQKKASLVLPTLKTYIEQGNLIDAKKALSSMVKLIEHRSKKNIIDIDPDLHKNAGFVGTDAIHIDIGSFQDSDHISQTKCMKANIEKVFSTLRLWLQENSPELLSHLDAEISRIE